MLSPALAIELKEREKEGESGNGALIYKSLKSNLSLKRVRKFERVSIRN